MYIDAEAPRPTPCPEIVRRVREVLSRKVYPATVRQQLEGFVITKINIEQLTALEQVFARLTPDGWSIPRWLDRLRRIVHGYDDALEPVRRYLR